ncbi:MAG: hypothetical protein KDL31_13565, partial [Kiritimatiellae bacterium]|nr:hypothetical protein [Kiritimatiellia bacterium]
MKSGSGTTESQSPWYVQTPEQEVYGPIRWDELRAWAEEGRIAPDYRLSQDQVSWQDAVSVEGLEMDWIADMGGDQQLGPFPLAAFRDFLHLGIIQPDSPLTNRVTGSSGVLSSLLAPEGIPAEGQDPEIVRLQSERIEALEAELGESRAALSQTRSELDDLRRQIKASSADAASKAEASRLAMEEKVQQVSRLQQALD